MRPALLSAVVLALAGSPLHAQVSPSAPDMQGMLEAMEQAQSAANRPGDDDLSCEQLLEELGVTTNDPALQAGIQAGVEQAQKDKAAMEQAQAEIASQTATTVVGSLVPGASMGAMAATAANAEAAKARGADRVQSRAAMGAQLTEALPAMMRGQRIIELAAARKCEWAEDIDPAAVAAKPAE